ncbi:MAG TPA: cyanophycin synthetase, partial [Acidimicrobiales bacterium]|nr:cyanophycin synthetase [Acidimicrobiales bacterium]
AVLNGDDPRTRAMASLTDAPALLYSAAGGPGADLVAEDVEVGDDLRARFVLRSPWGTTRVRLEARGAHQVGNALAAIAVGGVVGVGVEEAGGALESAVLSPYRMEVLTTPSGATLINDAYNANPTSMEAALRALASLPAGRRIAVLGPMAELGVEAAPEHRRMAALAAELGVEVLAVGTAAYGVAPEERIEDVVDRLAVSGPGVAILVKGSRVAALERVAAGLAGGEREPGRPG